MMTEEQVIDILKPIQEPFLHKSIVEANSVKEIRVKENYVSLKIAITQANSPEQMQLQQEIVNTLKGAGVESVGLRFEQRQEEGQTQSTSDETKSSDKKTTFIAVASGKGGVGKSTVSVNLATSLAREGKKVGLIDADIYGFSVPDMMGIAERPKVAGEQIFPVERFGVKVISMAFFVEDNAPVIWRGPMLGKMLNNFFNDIEWGDIDYMILDLPPGTGDVALDVHKMLPQSKELIVTTPHPTAAFVAARAGAMALKTDHDVLGVIENMAYFESKKTGEKEYVFGQGGADKLTEELQTEVIGRIPLGQPEMRDDDFAPSVYTADSKIGKIYQDIAKKVIEKVEK
ncbi:Mrp/NBP35 family ATP-binding protein [Pseudalkalibacillus berkeleyi]|uniref:Iron-sulfur cluster carrier protein n=1 Tax=Pseudalkalibacillus berkeleyi TaxID=1069813 RepID=A0ABS9H5Q9_9BACL|nr:Mrp/NBP35 family ATP-binding protein [Pseudalkalibacillus berkeleyi]MCF6139436.1 Mrp/NBP35 family ATP-binding protein [Pseudalkalibacillus berkeleyi]